MNKCGRITNCIWQFFVKITEEKNLLNVNYVKLELQVTLKDKKLIRHMNACFLVCFDKT